MGARRSSTRWKIHRRDPDARIRDWRSLKNQICLCLRLNGNGGEPILGKMLRPVMLQIHIGMAQLKKLLEESRRELLDLSTRNRLLSIPVESKSARVIHVRDEKSDVVFRLLVDERKAMGFLPGVERKSKPPPTLATVPIVGDFKEEEEEINLPQPDGEIDEATQEARRRVDTKLQTALTSQQQMAHGVAEVLAGLQEEISSMKSDAEPQEGK